MTNNGVSGRGAAKVILLGEHAVVHGARALAASLPIGVVARATRRDGPFELRVPKWNFKIVAGDGSLSEQGMNAVARTLDLSLDHTDIEVDAEVPARSGLGASAAVATATARALVTLHGKRVSDEVLFSAVQASEGVFHGTPSGIDATLSLGNGVIMFSRAAGATPVPVSSPRLVVVHSGEPGDTRHTVARFADRMRSAPEAGARRVEAIDALVERGISALRAGDEAGLGRLMVENHEMLQWFGVSSPALDRIVGAAMGAGALGAKMTGGGGGGCAVVLPGEAEAAVIGEIRSLGFHVMAL